MAESTRRPPLTPGQPALPPPAASEQRSQESLPHDAASRSVSQQPSVRGAPPAQPSAPVSRRPSVRSAAGAQPAAGVPPPAATVRAPTPGSMPSLALPPPPPLPVRLAAARSLTSPCRPLRSPLRPTHATRGGAARRSVRRVIATPPAPPAPPAADRVFAHRPGQLSPPRPPPPPVAVPKRGRGGALLTPQVPLTEAAAAEAALTAATRPAPPDDSDEVPPCAGAIDEPEQPVLDPDDALRKLARILGCDGVADEEPANAEDAAVERLAQFLLPLAQQCASDTRRLDQSAASLEAFHVAAPTMASSHRGSEAGLSRASSARQLQAAATASAGTLR
eukprot:TRINITY_DN30725_c0_g1_i1.p1 TRINITY_DN30725_c0_g1~~TRINITY_DN30725_c0_g1_i1.p1  ORF type:complete len:349 (+),score=93.65 TRINITY_DN30725_c0_g1_i1:45-1049(+)